jgi:hypothetical protein
MERLIKDHMKCFLCVRPSEGPCGSRGSTFKKSTIRLNLRFLSVTRSSYFRVTTNLYATSEKMADRGENLRRSGENGFALIETVGLGDQRHENAFRNIFISLQIS